MGSIWGGEGEKKIYERYRNHQIANLTHPGPERRGTEKRGQQVLKMRLQLHAGRRVFSAQCKGMLSDMPVLEAF